MEAVTERQSERTDVTIIGRVDSLSAPELERKLMEILDRGETNLLLDMERTEYLSSAGIRTILRIAKRLEVLGGNIAFRGVRGMVLDVFRMTGIDRVFHLDEEASTGDQVL